MAGWLPSWSLQAVGQSVLLQGGWLSSILTCSLSLSGLREGRKMGCVQAFSVCQGTAPGAELRRRPAYSLWGWDFIGGGAAQGSLSSRLSYDLMVVVLMERAQPVLLMCVTALCPP